MSETKLKIGSRIKLTDRDLTGTVAFIGVTQFSPGKWVGVVLDEPKGKNNGTVQGKRYFTCDDDFGLFLRPTQVTLLDSQMDSSLIASELSESSIVFESPSKPSSASTTSLASEPRSSVSTKGAGKPKTASTEQLVQQTPAGGSSPSLLSPRVKPAQSTAKHTKSPETLPSEPKRPSATSLHEPDSISAAPGASSAGAQPSVTLPVVETTIEKPKTEPSTVVRMHSSETELELTNLRAEIKTLTDQVEALRSKREEDRTRLQEMERLKIQITQLEENRRRSRDQAAELQRELAQLKTEKAEIHEAFDRYREEMSDVVENLEMATLDKEMAEEKLDSLNSEIELLKEQIEELTLENQILKEESTAQASASGDGSGPTPQQLKNLEQQNERLKQVLINLRDLSNQDKLEITRLNKELSSVESERNQLKTEKERLSGELKQSLEQMIELKDQVDAALGADQMVDQLTQRNLELEERCEKLTEERNDLEALCEMNDELQENSRETERELREEIDQCRTQINQLVRHVDACRETIGDYEKTVGKFRDLVTDLQAQNGELRRSLAEDKRRQVQSPATPVETLPVAPLSSGFGLVSETQTMVKMIEAELRRMEAEEMGAHVTRLTAFLPDSFLRRGGDNDALLVLLLIERLATKTGVLANHLCERYPLPACVPGQAKPPAALTATSDEADQTHGQTEDLSAIYLPGSAKPLPPMTKVKAEFYSFITSLVYLLRLWSALMVEYKLILAACGVDLYLKLGSLYLEMSAHEKNVDRILELMRKDQLDENTPLEPIIQSVNYFSQLRSVHLTGERVVDCSTKLAEFVHFVLAGMDALAADATSLMILTGQQLDPLNEAAAAATASAGGPVGLKVEDEPASAPKTAGGLVGLLVDVVRFSTTMRICARRIRRRLPKDRSSQPISFSGDVACSLDKAAALLRDLVVLLRDTTRRAGQLAARGAEESGDLKPATVYDTCLIEACKEVLTVTGGARATQPDAYMRNTLVQLRDVITQTAVAMDHGEYDFDGTKQAKPQEPCSVRAAAYKQAQADLEGCRAKLELKDEEVRELQLSLKARASELSEMSVRVGLAEKRLENAGKGNEEKINRLEQKLEQMEAQQKRDVREHEQAIYALQADIETLEGEKADLKEKLKALSKKALLEGLIKSPISLASSPGRQTPITGSRDTELGSPTSRGSNRDVVFYTMEIQGLREAVRHLTSENSKLRGEKMLMQMKNLGSLKRTARLNLAKPTPASSDSDQQSPDSMKETSLTKVNLELAEIQKRIFAVLAHPRLVLLPQAAGTVPVDSTDASQPQETKTSVSSATLQLTRQTLHNTQLKRDLEELQRKAKDAIIKQHPSAFIKTDFGSFPSARMHEVLTTSCDIPPDARLISRLIFPGHPTESLIPMKLFLQPKQLYTFQNHLFSCPS